MNNFNIENLQQLGFTNFFETQMGNNKEFEVARVVAEHKERYIIKNTKGEFEAEIMGNLRFTARSRIDFPTVGDWINGIPFDNKYLIHSVFNRQTLIKRKAAGSISEYQPIASNIDNALIVQSVNRDFNINRIERYLTICYDTGVKPIIVITKIDLISEWELANIMFSITDRIKDVDVIAISNLDQTGIDLVKNKIIPGMTYCVLGSSGVGKSSLINVLSNSETLKTGAIGLGTDRGKHVTSTRQLIVLPGGGLLIDTPGMRELGIGDSQNGISQTFHEISDLANNCKYSDCSHTQESGCAVIEALEKGLLHPNVYENYLKLIREQAHFESSEAEKRQKGKDLAKMIKSFKRQNYK